MNDKKDNKDNKVSIKLERHRWPDEIEREKRNRRRKLILVAAVLLSFGFGWQMNTVLKKNKVFIGFNESSRFDHVYNDVLNYWYFIDDYENPKEELIDHAIKGMLEQNQDPHTAYLTEEESQGLMQSINRDFEGIGVQYHAGESNLVTRVFKGSPAEKAGVQAGDVIYKVDGESLDGLDSDQIRDKILGESGTSVNVEFIRKGEHINFDIKRDKIHALVWGEMVADNVGYVEVTSFGNNLAQSMKLYLDDLMEKGADRLIIDLRNNGGGYLKAIEEIAPIFFENNSVVYQEDHREEQNKVFNVTMSEKTKYPFKKIVILQNENSASASEVFALAMRENLETEIVGVQSYGKGTIQVQKTYKDNSVLKLTVAKWLSPSGKNIDLEGIKPDVEVKLADIFYEQFVELEKEKVKYDSVHDAVAYVQKAFKYLGLHEGRTDGYFDQATKSALNKFQEENKYEKTDYIDHDLMVKIYSAVVSDWSTNQDEKDLQMHKAIEVVQK